MAIRMGWMSKFGSLLGNGAFVRIGAGTMWSKVEREARTRTKHIAAPWHHTIGVMEWLVEDEGVDPL
jgi:hypothetical protein